MPDLLGIDGNADVLVLRLSDPFGVVSGLSASLELDPEPAGSRVRVHSSAEYAHDLRLFRLPGGQILPLTKLAPGLFEALDTLAPVPDLTYVVEDRRGVELDRVAGVARVTAAGPDDAPWVLPVRYEPGAAVFRMRSPGGIQPRLAVYDLRGRRVSRLEPRPDGDSWYEARWTGTDFRGRPVGSGRYLVRASIGAYTRSLSVLYR